MVSLVNAVELTRQEHLVCVSEIRSIPVPHAKVGPRLRRWRNEALCVRPAAPLEAVHRLRRDLTMDERQLLQMELRKSTRSLRR